MTALKCYSMNETNAVAMQGASIIERFLKQYPHTVSILNVEDDPRFQKIDIDFVWVVKPEKNPTCCYTLELKVDRYKTGNFFFETHSNLDRQTPGCFLYTEADYLLYYFIKQETLYILPTQPVRTWFLANLSRFQEKRLETHTETGKRLYESAGRLVPISTLLSELGPLIQVHHVPVKSQEKELKH